MKRFRSSHNEFKNPVKNESAKNESAPGGFEKIQTRGLYYNGQ
jgi:hypothetical protein